MGATDVVPFVPVEGLTLDDCADLARRLGARIGEELGIPVFLYEAAATRPDRVSLADVRRGQFEGLRERIGADPERRPDFGPERIHPTAGATAVGARRFLVAFNANLNTGDVRVAKAVAAAIREQSGGLKQRARARLLDRGRPPRPGEHEPGEHRGDADPSRAWRWCGARRRATAPRSRAARWWD